MSFFLLGPFKRESLTGQIAFGPSDLGLGVYGRSPPRYASLSQQIAFGPSCEDLLCDFETTYNYAYVSPPLTPPKRENRSRSPSASSGRGVPVHRTHGSPARSDNLKWLNSSQDKFSAKDPGCQSDSGKENRPVNPDNVSYELPGGRISQCSGTNDSATDWNGNRENGERQRTSVLLTESDEFNSNFKSTLNEYRTSPGIGEEGKTSDLCPPENGTAERRSDLLDCAVEIRSTSSSKIPKVTTCKPSFFQRFLNFHSSRSSTSHSVSGSTEHTPTVISPLSTSSTKPASPQSVVKSNAREIVLNEEQPFPECNTTTIKTNQEDVHLMTSSNVTALKNSASPR